MIEGLRNNVWVTFLRNLAEMKSGTTVPQEVRDLQEQGIFEITDKIRADRLRFEFSSFTPQTPLSEFTR